MAEVGARAEQRAVVSGAGRLLLGAHLVAGALVVVGVLAQVLRPLAPDLGPPPPPTVWFDAAHLAQVTAYRQPLYAAGVAALVLRLAVPCLAAFSGPGRRFVDGVVRRVGEHRPARAATAVVLAVVVITDLVVFPLAFWAGYVHEGAFGFRVHGLAGWARDWAVEKTPTWLVVATLTLGGYALARRLPRAWPPVAGAATALLAAAFVLVTPVVLEPLVFSTDTLPNGPVRAEVQRVLDRSDHQVERIVVADASRRTTKRNAYLSGLGPSRQVVLYDTLVESQPPDEVGAVLAHELAHHLHADLVRGTLLAAAGTTALCYLLAAVLRRRVRSGRQRTVGDPRAAAVVLALVVLATVVTAPVANAVSRRAEAAADLGALRITGAPATFQRLNAELARANLSDPLPPRWVQLLWSTHPPPSARLEMGRRWEEGLLR
ncbi:MAG TPA: M48 family metalloprotease [Egibacteraceae bacterium]|nr:M48 family metalloprotease [Egibacteraceae bacterium]